MAQVIQTSQHTSLATVAGFELVVSAKANELVALVYRVGMHSVLGVPYL